VAKQRVQTQYAANQVRLTPQASPVNTYVQPARNDQISKALDAVAGNLNRKRAKDERKESETNAALFQVQKVQAVEAAYANGDLGSWSKTSNELSLADDPKYGPMLQIAYNQNVGTQTGLKIQSELYTWDSENSGLRLSDPVAYAAALDTKTRELLQENMGPDSVDAVGFASSIRTQVSAAQSQLKSQQSQEYRIIQGKIPLENFLSQLQGAVNVANLSGKDLTDAERMVLIGDSVAATVKATVNTKTIDPKQINAATTDYLITLATETKNLDILKIAKRVSTGNGGYLYGILSEKKKFITAQKQLADQLSAEEYKDYAAKQRLQAAAKENFQEAAYQYYNLHGDFEEFEGPSGSDVLGAYDIEVIQNRIASFKESVVLTQQDYETYYDQFSNVTELTQGRGVEIIESMRLETRAEWSLANAAMRDVLNKRGSVYNGESYKSAKTLIDQVWQINPQNQSSLASLSSKALDEYNRSVADFRERVTSYIIDQRVLNKDLEGLGFEDFKDQSIHQLPPAVKYQLYKDAASDAAQKHLTDTAGNSLKKSPILPTNGTVTINGVPVTIISIE
jgi:hypothetical protein